MSKHGAAPHAETPTVTTISNIKYQTHKIPWLVIFLTSLLGTRGPKISLAIVRQGAHNEEVLTIACLSPSCSPKLDATLMFQISQKHETNQLTLALFIYSHCDNKTG